MRGVNGKQRLLTLATALVIEILAGFENGAAPHLWAQDSAKSSQKKSAADALDSAVDSVPLTYEKDIKPLLQTYCFDCHGKRRPRAGLNLTKYENEQAILEGRKLWERVANMIRTGEMPPKKQDNQPTDEDRELLYHWITREINRIDCTGDKDPGRVTIRRLNRFEYNNTIRDLVGVGFQPAADFPTDDVGYGFDNIGDVLSLPPILFEKYFSAAEKITDAAIVASSLKGEIRSYSDSKFIGDGQDFGDGARMLSSSGKIGIEFEVPQTGKYVARFRAFETHAGDEYARMGVILDGKQIQSFEVRGTVEYPRSISIQVELTAGQHKLEGSFLNDYYKPDDPDPKNRDRNMGIAAIEIQGPLTETPQSEITATHRKIFIRTPKADMSDAEECARAIIGTFARRAFRRPIEREELDRLIDLGRDVMLDGESFERAIEVTIQAILVSPHFLFKVETDAEPDNPKAIHPINDFELATRLSYFLWSSMPDDELFRLASQNGLRSNNALRRQVERMLKDPKADAFIESFSGQWLSTRNLKQMTPDPKLFPSFNEELRESMRKETELFFGEIVRSNHSLLDLLDANFTFVDGRLAQHYQIPNITGDRFQRVTLDNRRGGILTHASILTLTSNPTRTSPVKRGKWVLENILGAPPPPPPPGVEELKTDEKSVLSGTLRQRMEQHRANPSCASCHQTMDPLGFGFENFDGIGAWREKDGNFEIDPTGTLPTGESFTSPQELKTILKSRKDEFCRCVTEKLLTYALGRGLEYFDKCVLDSISEAVAKDQYRMMTLIQEIVHSEPFLKRRGKKD